MKHDVVLLEYKLSDNMSVVKHSLGSIGRLYLLLVFNNFSIHSFWCRGFDMGLRLLSALRRKKSRRSIVLDEILYLTFKISVMKG